MKKNLLITSLAAALAAASAQADIVPIGLTWTPGAVVSEIDYKAGLSLAQQLLPGDSFWIMDLSTFVSISSAPPGWIAIAELTSTLPPTILVPDSPTEWNAHFIWAGGPVAGPAILGDFDILVDPTSVLDFGRRDDWVGAAHNAAVLGGLTDSNVNNVPEPVAVPEASTVSAAAGLALAAGAIGFNRRQRRRQRR